jgi:hypothetical protein
MNKKAIKIIKRADLPPKQSRSKKKRNAAARSKEVAKKDIDSIVKEWVRESLEKRTDDPVRSFERLFRAA